MTIEIVRAGQAGKTSLLFDMHRLRSRVFKDMLGWDVQVSEDGLEVDQFDLPEALYLLSLLKGQVVGAWRLLPSIGPTMIHDLWPEFTRSLPFPKHARTWEVSRFAVSPLATDRATAQAQCHAIVGEMFCGLTEFCQSAGIETIFTLYDNRIARLINRIDCDPYASSESLIVGGAPARIGAFRTDDAMLTRLRRATGIDCSLLPSDTWVPHVTTVAPDTRLVHA